MQNHLQHSPSLHRSKKQLIQHSTIGSSNQKGIHKQFDHHQYQTTNLSRQPRNNRRRLRTRPPDEPRDNSSSQRRISIDKGPNDNDVVCFSIHEPKRIKGVVVVQPNSKHIGNLQFCKLVRKYTRSYMRAVEANKEVSSFDPEKEQKRIADLIVAKIQIRGGRFVVWTKEDPSLLVHKNNGGWGLVSKEDIHNISRYALLKEVETLEKTVLHDGEEKLSSRQSKQPLSTQIKRTVSHQLESEAMNSTRMKGWKSDNSLTSSSTSSIVHILSGIGVDSEDCLDVWSGSPVNEKKTRKDDMDASCWEYKLLLPLTME